MDASYALYAEAQLGRYVSLFSDALHTHTHTHTACIVVVSIVRPQQGAQGTLINRRRSRLAALCSVTQCGDSVNNQKNSDQQPSTLKATHSNRLINRYTDRENTSCRLIDWLIDWLRQVHSARSSLTITHPSTNRGRRCELTSVVNVPLS